MGDKMIIIPPLNAIENVNNQNRFPATKSTSVEPILTTQESNNENITEHKTKNVNKKKTQKKSLKNKEKINLKCPSKFRPMKYPNTNFLLFCSMEKVKNTKDDSSNVTPEESEEKVQMNDCPGILLLS